MELEIYLHDTPSYLELYMRCNRFLMNPPTGMRDNQNDFLHKTYLYILFSIACFCYVMGLEFWFAFELFNKNLF